MARKASAEESSKVEPQETQVPALGVATTLRTQHPVKESGVATTVGSDDAPLLRALEGLLPFARMLYQRRALFLALMVGSAVILLGAVFLQTPKYTSTAYLLVKFGRELVYRPEVSDGSSSNFAQRNKESVLNSELVIARSQPVLTEVVNHIGIERLYPAQFEQLQEALAGLSPEQATALEQRATSVVVEKFRKALTVQALPGSDVIRIAVEHASPEVAADAANNLIQALTAKHLEVFGDRRFVEFLEQRVDSYRSALENAELRLNQFQTSNQSFAVGDAQGDLAERRAELRAAVLKVDEQIGDVRLRALQKDSAYSEAEIELLQLRSEEARTTGVLQRDVRQRIAIVSRFLASRRAEASRQVAEQEAKRAALETELAEIGEVFTSLPGLSSEHRSLLRERDAVEDQYRTYQKRLREARISYDMDREKLASIRVIQEAFPPLEPTRAISPKVQAGFALVLAVILAGLGTTLVASFDDLRKRRAQGAYE